MANEKRLIPCGEKVTLDELPCGTIFAFGDDCIAVKSEYRCNNGLIEAFIIDSGEQFWGGVHTAKEQNELMVQPLEIVDALEVVHGEWGEIYNCHGERLWGYRCSQCEADNSKKSNYCPNCGAKMDVERKDNEKETT